MGVIDTILEDSPALCWPLDDPTSSAVQDVSGNARPGTWPNGNGGVLLNQPAIVPNPSSKSMTFVGTGSSYYIARAYESGLNVGTGDFAFECWIKSTSNLGNWVQIGGRDSDDNGMQALYLHQTTGVVRFYVGGSALDGTVAVNDAKLHHLFVQRASGHAQIYVDGVLDIDTGGFTGNTDHSEAMHLGTLGGSYNSYNGGMCFWSYYMHALTADRIAAHRDVALKGGGVL